MVTVVVVVVVVVVDDVAAVVGIKDSRNNAVILFSFLQNGTESNVAIFCRTSQNTHRVEAWQEFKSRASHSISINFRCLDP